MNRSSRRLELGAEVSVRIDWSWLLAGVGAAASISAALLNSEAARSAAVQDWPPFVLVAGLLLIGLVANDDGVFSAAGQWLGRVAPSGFVLFAGTAVGVGVVTALLNLDTAVAFLTPVLVYAARKRGEGEAALLYGCLLLSNAGSLFLPGSNLTNLILVGQLHLTGGQFLARMGVPGLVALVVTALVVGGIEHRALRIRIDDVSRPKRPTLGLGALAIVAAAVLVVVLRNPALPVAAVGVATVAIRVGRGKERVRRAAGILGLPTLVGLFGLAVALGTLGRVWSGPSDLLGHLDPWATSAVAAVGSVLLNNLPAASLFAAHRPMHPFSLLVGLDLGPNLFVTGSLSWILWIRAARSAGAQPSIRHATRLGVIAAPLSMAAALGVLTAHGLR